MIGANSEMQRITGAQGRRILAGESCRRAELQTRHRQGGKAANRKAGEHRQRIGAMGNLDPPGVILMEEAACIRLPDETEPRGARRRGGAGRSPFNCVGKSPLPGRRCQQ